MLDAACELASRFLLQACGCPVALFLPGRPVQLSACEGFAEDLASMDLAISYHVEVTIDTVVRGISWEDRSGSVL